MDAVILAYMGKTEALLAPGGSRATAHIADEVPVVCLMANGVVSAMYGRGQIGFVNSWYPPHKGARYATYPYPKTHEEIENIMKKTLAIAGADPGTASFQVLSDIVMLAVKSYEQFRAKHSK